MGGVLDAANNIKPYSILSRSFSRAFGFTQAEVDGLLVRTGLEEGREAVREWYGGYVFGDEELYCLGDVADYVSDCLRNPRQRPKNYWAHSSESRIIRDFACREEFKVGPKFETLMSGGTITQTISDALTYDTRHQTEDDLWSVLVMTGYLTKADPKERRGTISLRIPNKEIADSFETLRLACSRTRSTTRRRGT